MLLSPHLAGLSFLTNEGKLRELPPTNSVDCRIYYFHDMAARHAARPAPRSYSTDRPPTFFLLFLMHAVYRHICSGWRAWYGASSLAYILLVKAVIPTAERQYSARSSWTRTPAPACTDTEESKDATMKELRPCVQLIQSKAYIWNERSRY